MREIMKRNLIFIPILILLSGCMASDFLPESKSDSSSTAEVNTDNQYASNKEIKIDSCSLSGERQANVKVDIGYGDRNYYAYTNENSQLVYVEASEIELQNDDQEDVTSSNRYCSDEAKVPGVEDADLDEGHAIADSLGGVSNAYNITPQESTLNRHGAQAEMEELIRESEANGEEVTDFIYTIEYSDSESQIPSSYAASFKIDGEEVTYSFTNEYDGEVESSYTEDTSGETANGNNFINYENCTEVKEAGAAPLHKGDPGYSEKLDRDGDGEACTS